MLTKILGSGSRYVSTLIHTDVLEYWDVTLSYTAAPLQEERDRGADAGTDRGRDRDRDREAAPLLGTRHSPAHLAPPSAAPIKFEISTNRGKDWCEIELGESLGLDSPDCHVPAKNFMYRLRFNGNVRLSALELSFALSAPQRSFDFDLGTNIPIMISRV